MIVTFRRRPILADPKAIALLGRASAWGRWSTVGGKCRAVAVGLLILCAFDSRRTTYFFVGRVACFRRREAWGPAGLEDRRFV
jgi:hypothetical protein